MMHLILRYLPITLQNAQELVLTQYQYHIRVNSHN